MAYYSFGGWKSSLFGDSHAHGTEGVHFFTRGKVVTARWLDPSHGGLNLGFRRTPETGPSTGQRENTAEKEQP
jgi:malonate-semialdehyde dehydrogenase (acetylating)/methylmalonate-semialdehyde dehydrogenase